MSIELAEVDRTKVSANFPALRLAKSEFTARLKEEGSWGERDMGSHECEMVLYQTSQDYMLIEWEVGGELVASIGCWLEIRDGREYLSDYDGVFSLPKEVIELLEAVNVIVEEDFR